jgi:hypothetical protein
VQAITSEAEKEINALSELNDSITNSQANLLNAI